MGKKIAQDTPESPKSPMDDINSQLLSAVQYGITNGIKEQLSRNYNNPLEKMIADLLVEQMGPIRGLLKDAVQSAVGNEEFRQQIAEQVRHKLANVLVSRFGGEMERQVNLLKSDPATRARITVAIEEIVKERSQTV